MVILPLAEVYLIVILQVVYLVITIAEVSVVILPLAEHIRIVTLQVVYLVQRLLWRLVWLFCLGVYLIVTLQVVSWHNYCGGICGRNYGGTLAK